MNMMHLCLITFFTALEQRKKIIYGKYNFINNYKTTFGPKLAGTYWVIFKFVWIFSLFEILIPILALILNIFSFYKCITNFEYKYFYFP